MEGAGKYPAMLGQSGHSAPPMGLWSPEKADRETGTVHFVGGSMPEDGHAPLDLRPDLSMSVSTDTFFGKPVQSDGTGMKSF